MPFFSFSSTSHILLPNQSIALCIRVFAWAEAVTSQSMLTNLYNITSHVSEPAHTVARLQHTQHPISSHQNSEFRTKHLKITQTYHRILLTLICSLARARYIIAVNGVICSITTTCCWGGGLKTKTDSVLDCVKYSGCGVELGEVSS